jgi:hypothetical protein
MGWLDNGPKDTSTPEKRKEWRDRAQEQMDEQASKNEADKEPGASPRHATKRGLFS